MIMILCCIATGHALESVQVVRDVISLPTTTWPLGEGQRAHKPNRRAPGVQSMVDVEVIKLNNGLVEAWIAPELAGRLLRAVDIKTGVDYFWWSGKLDSHLPWAEPGGSESQLPVL